MTFTSIAEQPTREVIPGFHGQFVHGDNVTLAHWHIEAGATLPEHAHPHEQITWVLEGRLSLTVGGVTRVVEQGGVAVIPGGMAHSGQALTPCRVVDVFYPRREDYR
ncbi:MAG: cupin domain-containing protein [Anaerolineae bacterium]